MPSLAYANERVAGANWTQIGHRWSPDLAAMAAAAEAGVFGEVPLDEAAMGTLQEWIQAASEYEDPGPGVLAGISATPSLICPSSSSASSSSFIGSSSGPSPTIGASSAFSSGIRNPPGGTANSRVSGSRGVRRTPSEIGRESTLEGLCEG